MRKAQGVRFSKRSRGGSDGRAAALEVAKWGFEDGRMCLPLIRQQHQLKLEQQRQQLDDDQQQQ